MPNIKSIIQAHNKKLLAREDNESRNQTRKKCNCRKPAECPLSGECLTKGIIYQATVTPKNGDVKQTYIGLTECEFKQRYNNHTSSFRNNAKRNATELSNYIWELKDKNIAYNISWKIMSQAKAYNISRNKCALCTAEKYYIIFEPDKASLNGRRELVTTCRHSSKYILSNYKS